MWVGAALPCSGFSAERSFCTALLTIAQKLLALKSGDVVAVAQSSKRKLPLLFSASIKRQPPCSAGPAAPHLMSPPEIHLRRLIVTHIFASDAAHRTAALRRRYAPRSRD